MNEKTQMKGIFLTVFFFLLMYVCVIYVKLVHFKQSDSNVCDVLKMENGVEKKLKSCSGTLK